MDLGLFIVVLFIIAAVMRVDFFFYLLYVFGAVYLISRLWIPRALRQVAVQRHIDAQAFWGEKVSVRLEIRNAGILPLPWLQLQETLPQPLAFPPVRSRALSLWPRERAEFSYELDCRQRGYYAIGPLRLSSGDLLDAGGRVYAEAGVSHLTVFPRILPLEDLGIPSRSPFGTVRHGSAIHRDPSRTAGVREYRPGDTIRHINWKASAVTGTLQTKVFDPVISLDTAVFLDLERGHYDAAHAVITTEEAVSVAASFVVQLARRRQPFSLASNGVDPLAAGDRGPVLPMRSGQAHLTTVLSALGRIENRESEPFAAMLQREALNLPWGCTVLVVTGSGEGILPYCLQLRRSGFNVVVLLADYYSDLRAPARELERAGATVYRLRATESLEKVAK
ncbi:MAG: DUF58 domain-containing protein [Anaerolineae bacterium]